MDVLGLGFLIHVKPMEFFPPQKKPADFDELWYIKDWLSCKQNHSIHGLNVTTMSRCLYLRCSWIGGRWAIITFKWVEWWAFFNAIRNLTQVSFAVDLKQRRRRRRRAVLASFGFSNISISIGYTAQSIISLYQDQFSISRVQVNLVEENQKTKLSFVYLFIFLPQSWKSQEKDPPHITCTRAWSNHFFLLLELVQGRRQESSSTRTQKK